MIEEARAAQIPFRLVVADSVYGEHAQLEAHLYTAHIPYVMGLRPSHGTWQVVEDEQPPPAFTPAEAAQRRPKEAWQRTVRFDTHGKELVRYVAEVQLGPSYGPERGVRLIAATLDPVPLQPESTWYLATALSLSEASPEQVYELSRLRDWIAHYYKPAQQELGWADCQLRPEQAIVRHWQLVLLAFTFSLLVGALPGPSPHLANAPVPTSDPLPASAPVAPDAAAGGKIRHRVRGAGRLERHATPGAGVAVPLGTSAAVLAALVERRPTARAGRAPRPRRQRPPA